MTSDILKKDLYDILGVAETATEKEIVRGYRKRALKCHPDKNPDNPRAAEQFQELSKALEILTDEAARRAYDQSKKAKKAALERNKHLDEKRKKFKDDLEVREKAAAEQISKSKTEAAERQLQKEIERLRKEGSRLLEEEQERLRQQLKHSHVHDDQLEILSQPVSHATEVPRIKLKWRAEKVDCTNGGYSESLLRTIFSQYGQINALIVSSQRKGSALVELEKNGLRPDIVYELGLKSNPLSVTWLSGKPSKHVGKAERSLEVNGANISEMSGSNDRKTEVSFIGSNKFDSSVVYGGQPTIDDRNFESIVLMKMRQAEERKRLIEQLQKEDVAD